jgi:hypothetical protein
MGRISVVAMILDAADCRAQCQTALGQLQQQHGDAAADCFPPLPAPTSCAGLLACQSACIATIWRTDCSQACGMSAPSAVNAQVNAALLCGVDECVGMKSRPARCDLLGANDAPGQPAGACQECIHEAVDPLQHGGMCDNESSPDCRGGVDCQAEWAPCLAH